MATSQKVIVSERALVARINRKIKGEELQLKKCREGSRGFSTLGEYYTVDFSRNTVSDSQIDLSDYAKKLGVLADHEVLER